MEFRNAKKKPIPKRKNTSPYMLDRKILPRISEYLDAAKSKAISVDDITDYLQANFLEYSRKKRPVLNQSVVKALTTLSTTKDARKIDSIEQRYLRKRQKTSSFILKDRKDDLTPSDDSDFSLNDEPLEEYQDTNIINNSMHNLYKNTRKISNNDNETNEEVEVKDSSMVPSSMVPMESTPTVAIIKQEPEIDNCNENITPHADEMKAWTSNKSLWATKDSNNEHSSLYNNQVEKTTSRKEMKGPLSRISEDDRTASSRPGTPIKKSRSSKKKIDGIKEKTKKFEPTVSNTTFKDIGGYSPCIEEISKLLFHIKHPEVFKSLGIKPPRGFLLHGPPGCGKSLMANAIAGELQIPFFKIAATEVVSGISGETEQTIRNLFAEAVSCAPSILFLDEIDSITPKRENAGKEMERRIVTQILTCMDELSAMDANVLVIGATNRVDALDPALRRAGRFDREISMGIPDRNARKDILQVICRGMSLSENFDYELIAIKTPGFVGADLQSLVREAAMCAVDSIFESLKDVEKVSKNLFVGTPSSIGSTPQEKAQENIKGGSSSWLSEKLLLTDDHLKSLCINVQHFEQALPSVQPSSKREGFATVPDVTWNDIGALEDVREELSMAVMAPVQNPIEFESLGLTTPPGILLAGPPGCGKTLLAKAIANEAGINFISVKGPELLNMYVGESERAVRQVFERARNSSPCVIFFDEIDALTPRRSETGDSSASSRVVNQLLTEMDGLQARKQVFVMGATNRPDILDPAILRPGRLDKLLYVGLPNHEDRVKILNAITKNGTKPQLSPEITIDLIASNERCDGYSGADLNALVREASVSALKEFMSNRKLKEEQIDADPQSNTIQSIRVKMKHFEVAFQKVKPSVGGKDRLWYEAMKEKHSKNI